MTLNIKHYTVVLADHLHKKFVSDTLNPLKDLYKKRLINQQNLIARLINEKNLLLQLISKVTYKPANNKLYPLLNEIDTAISRVKSNTPPWDI